MGHGAVGQDLFFCPGKTVLIQEGSEKNYKVGYVDSWFSHFQE